MTDAISNIRVTAPLFEGAEPDKLFEIVEHLSSASHHYADDSGKEWGLARQSMDKAAAKCNALSLGYTAIQALHKHKHQLVLFSDLMDVVLKQARTEETTQ